MENNFNTNNEVQQAVNAALDAEKKKKKKTKWIVIAVIAIVLVVIIAAAGGSGDSETEDAGAAEQTVEAANKNEEKKADGVIGDYVCKVKSAEVCKDWEGKDAVKITYEFTNNSEKSQSFDIALEDHVYQDGVGLETAIVSEDDATYFDVEIKNGVTKDVVKYYLLRDTSTPLEVEIGEWLSFDDTKITVTVNL